MAVANWIQARYRDFVKVPFLQNIEYVISIEARLNRVKWILHRDGITRQLLGL